MAFDLDIKYIEILENMFDSTLPVKYKNEMVNYNGGIIFIEDEEWELFPISDTSSHKRIARTMNNVFDETQKAKNWNNFLDNFISIASNGTGDLMILIQEKKICLDEIYIWRHETGQITKIANSFDDFDIE